MLKAAWQAWVVGRLQNLACCWMLPLPLIYFLGKKKKKKITVVMFPGSTIISNILT